MTNKDSSYLPLKKATKKCNELKNPNKLWLFVFHNLINFTNKSEEFLSFIRNSPLHVFFSSASSKLSSTLETVNFSLDENLSSTHLTPFHLSSIDCTSQSLKSKGQFFTPLYISSYIVKQSFQHFMRVNRDKSLNQSSIADIACGTGNLIIPILAYARDNIFKDQKVLSADFLKFITSNLFGFDLDPFALAICKLRIFFYLSLHYPDASLPNLSSNFQLGNSLLNEPFDTASEMEFFTKPVPYLSNSTPGEFHFDIIVSNPPYMCYGLRNAQNYSQEYKTLLRQNFYSAEYKLSLFPIFIERSIKLLKNYGVLGIITPDSFLLGRYYSKIRSFILRNSKILEIDLLGFEPFSHVTVGRSTISFYQKGVREKEKSLENLFRANWITTKDAFEKGNWGSHENNQTKFLENPVNRFQLFFNDKDERFVKLWKESSQQCLEDLVTIHTGIRSKIGQKNIISISNKGETWKKGIISSSQIHPFHIYYKDNWINVDPEILWSGGFNREIIEKPKILIRQTGYKIVTAVDEEGFYHLNNVHSISAVNDKVNIFALSTILNSSNFNRLYHILSLEKGRALAQIDIDFLLKMPILDFPVQDVEILQEFYFKNQQKERENRSISSYALEDVVNRKIFQDKI